jgi:hypothetical protein
MLELLDACDMSSRMAGRRGSTALGSGLWTRLLDALLDGEKTGLVGRGRPDGWTGRLVNWLGADDGRSHERADGTPLDGRRHDQGGSGSRQPART